MTVNDIANLLLVAAAVVWILARQVQVARVKPRLLLLVPLVLAYFGIRALPASTWHVPADLGLLALSAAVSVGLGVWRGPARGVAILVNNAGPATGPLLLTGDLAAIRLEMDTHFHSTA